MTTLRQLIPNLSTLDSSVIIVGTDFIQDDADHTTLLTNLKRVLFVFDIVFISTLPDHGSNIPNLIDAVSSALTSSNWYYQFKNGGYSGVPNLDYLTDVLYHMDNVGSRVAFAVPTSRRELDLYRKAKLPVFWYLHEDATVN